MQENVVTVDFMMDESNDNTNDVIKQHKLNWRSISMFVNLKTYRLCLGILLYELSSNVTVK